jgi:hypothetical protein
MKLADHVAQCRVALAVNDPASGREVKLGSAADYAERVAQCPLRYVLDNELTRLCTELAYSKGARSLACADLLHVPAEVLWVEWCNEPWQSTLERCGFLIGQGYLQVRRHGALIHSAPSGRRGTIRTFWNAGTDGAVLASSMEAYFDFDTPDGEDPAPPDTRGGGAIRVYDGACKGEDVLGRCFRFRYERAWSDYYAGAALSRVESGAVRWHSLGTIAINIPVLLAFMLLLASRAGLPRRPQTFERLNRSRRKAAKAPLLDHIEVRAPVLPEYLGCAGAERHHARRGPRLHHVRGHLVRRGNQLFWRIPHLRGSARSGIIRARTVTWTFDDPSVRHASS